MLLAISFLNLAMLASNIDGGTPAPRDVVECLLSLPADIAPFDGLPVERRKDLLADSTTTIDKKNGYLSFTTDWSSVGWKDPFTIQVAVFTRRDKGFIVGVSRSNGESFDHSMHGIGFYEFISNEWQDVTSTVLPPLEMSDFWVSKKEPPAKVEFFFMTYDLPREGTTIRVVLNPWIRKKLDDGMQDISNERDWAEAAKLRAEVLSSARTVLLLWNQQKGQFLKRY